MDLKLQSYGERAILIQNLDITLQSSLVSLLQVSPPVGFVEFVLGYDNLMIVLNSAADLGAFRTWLTDLLEVGLDPPVEPRLIEVPTRYDGEDLDWVAKQSHLSVDEVIAIHSGAEYRVRMMGFAPGFPYLDGLDPCLYLDRRASPRNHIEPGSVAIGGSHAGIYSVASPGGWHLLGRTELPMFRPDLARMNEPDPTKIFTLRIGDRVKFMNLG
ncbi:MAG TPA: allophanate hydrolase [Opitutae bacterium]|nr:allophanate hydrolase [Opitutae bacterium]